MGLLSFVSWMGPVGPLTAISAFNTLTSGSTLAVSNRGNCYGASRAESAVGEHALKVTSLGTISGSHATVFVDNVRIAGVAKISFSLSLRPV